MVDIHCHILPQIDDGAESWDVATEMCHLASADGITHVVATPHANNEYTYDREQNLAILDRLSEITAGLLSFSLGCDFHFSYDNVEDALIHHDRYTIGDTNYLLIELSDYSIPPSFPDQLFRLSSAGFQPILTHPERNAILQRQPEQILGWADHGCIVQVTANSLTGRWGERALKVAQWLLRRDAVHVLATDAHDAESRPPILSAARDMVARWTDGDVAQALVQNNPSAIISGQELPFFPKPVLK